MTIKTDFFKIPPSISEKEMIISKNPAPLDRKIHAKCLGVLKDLSDGADRSFEHRSEALLVLSRLRPLEFREGLKKFLHCDRLYVHRKCEIAAAIALEGDLEGNNFLVAITLDFENRQSLSDRREAAIKLVKLNLKGAPIGFLFLKRFVLEGEQSLSKKVEVAEILRNYAEGRHWASYLKEKIRSEGSSDYEKIDAVKSLARIGIPDGAEFFREVFTKIIPAYIGKGNNEFEQIITLSELIAEESIAKLFLGVEDKVVKRLKFEMENNRDAIKKFEATYSLAKLKDPDAIER